MDISKTNKLHAAILGTALIMLILCLPTHFLQPITRGFDITDTTIQAILLPSTISTIAICPISVIAPLAVLATYFLIHRNRDAQVTIMSMFLISSLIAFALTNILKVTVGELRPDFLARCLPVNNTCTGDIKHITEGRKSFPSGHTAAAFHGTFFIILLPVLKTIRKTFDLKTIAAYVIIVLTFLSGTLYNSYTRYADHKHHIHDIVFGAILGTVVAMLSYVFLYVIDVKKNLSQEVKDEELVAMC